MWDRLFPDVLPKPMRFGCYGAFVFGLALILVFGFMAFLK